MNDLLLDVPPAGYRPGNSPFGSARPSVTHGNEHEFVIDNMVCSTPKRVASNSIPATRIQRVTAAFARLMTHAFAPESGSRSLAKRQDQSEACLCISKSLALLTDEASDRTNGENSSYNYAAFVC
ncbi:MAG TPA: hypothetical protein VN284_00945 [Rhizobium sp.]|uniref:hypothetical protein n=1 Tax=Rhizobium sp. F40D2 TaxID=3453141 RepID=UPI002CE216AA|nr:hypothetical protein [Rhizobium sp.]